MGEVTGGTFSPTLKKADCDGLCCSHGIQPGTELEVDLRGRAEPARVIELPFYQRDRRRVT